VLGECRKLVVRGSGEPEMLQLSLIVPAKSVETSIRSEDTVYLRKPCPLPGVLAPISFTKYGASAEFNPPFTDVSLTTPNPEPKVPSITTTVPALGE
jgi:hypothetical protein